ncbi:hypothetical protein OEZ86_014249 [Tetradesmus obliquus]|nr:hypothetical protein OEZ86_014249 [Tetradesmus obliquus]
MDQKTDIDVAAAASTSIPAAAETGKSPTSSSSGMTRTLSIGQHRKIKVKFSGEEDVLGMSPTGVAAEELMNKAAGKQARGAAWQRKILLDLQDETAFSSTELQVLLHHFSEHQTSDDHVDKETFFKSLGAAFCTSDTRLLQAMYAAMDDSSRGWISFSQFACALSTLYRGDKDDILSFWFRMYDRDRDGFLDKEDFERLLQDVNRTTYKEIKVYVDEEVFPEEGGGCNDPRLLLLSFQEFRTIMDEYDVIPIFVNPHKFAQHKQAPALRALSPAEREVLLLLGSDVAASQGQLLIQENDKCDHFFFLMEGEVQLQRGGINLGTLPEGSFVGEAALFSDIKQDDGEQSNTFTTAVAVTSEDARLLRLFIGDFHPLVYHQHPGATAIVQRLGRIMLERFQQTEDRLQAILAGQARQSEAGMRLSSRDWAAFRKRLTRQWALKYHKIGRTGKLEVVPTKLMGTKEDLSVAYSPGVAEPCLSIQQNEKFAYEYTAKGHLVGVITNGTAVLGLGNIGALAAKPVMEGKAVLFKKFADLDAFDLEVNCDDPVKLVDLLVALEPTFGGVNLEDIKAPECFYVEREAQRRMSIPVFHDDQHGTAIIAGAGLINALEIIGKDISSIRVVVCGCGAAGFTCAKYFVSLGVQQQNLIAVDVKGVVYTGREDLSEPDNYLSEVAVDTPLRTLKEAVAGADVFLGLSAGNLLTPEMLLSMARDPLVFACANPIPEIDPEIAAATRPDVIMATGRSDFPNQINNVCAFPYIFRGALDCRARAVNEEMKRAATYAIAALAKRPVMKRRSPSAGDLIQLATAAAAATAAAGAAPQQQQQQQSEQQAGAAANGSTTSSTLSTDVSAAAAESSGIASSTASSGTSQQNPPPDTPAAAGGRSGSPPKGHHRHTGSGKQHHTRRKSYGEGCFYTAAEGEGGNAPVVFGKHYIIPKPFDERLLPEVAGAVVEAAIATGVARLADIDIVQYKRTLADLALRTSM